MGGAEQQGGSLERSCPATLPLPLLWRLGLLLLPRQSWPRDDRRGDRVLAWQRGRGREELRAGCHPGPSLSVCPPSFVTTNCALQFSSRGIRPGLTTVLARNLDKNTVGYLQWRWGIQSAMNTSIVRDTKTSHFTVALQVRPELLPPPQRAPHSLRPSPPAGSEPPSGLRRAGSGRPLSRVLKCCRSRAPGLQLP